VVFLLALASIGLGLLVSSTTRSEGQIFPFIPAVIVPSLLLSGLLIPIDQLSWPPKALARLVPVTYAEDVLVPVFRDGGAGGGSARLPGPPGRHAAALTTLASSR
jgi:ABC-2 type transport system permease protein